jgi:hypothetical protein
MTSIGRLLRPVLVSLLLHGSAPQTTYYIATTGNDTNACTIGSPCATIGHVQSLIQTALASNSNQNITAYLRDGTYAIASTLSFGTADSPGSGYTVTWGSYPGEKAILSGGVAITGWSLCTTADAICNSGSGGVYQASVSSGFNFRELYVNGSHRTRSMELTGGGWNAFNGTYFPVPNSAAMATWKNLTNVELVIYSGNGAGWQMLRCKIGSVALSGSTAEVTPNAQCGGKYKTYYLTDFGAETSPIWVENVYELLPSCGQGCWYLDISANIVYYIPKTGENMSTATVVAPSLVDMFTGNAVSNLTFNRLTVEYVSWLAPDAGGNGYMGEQNGYLCSGSDVCVASNGSNVNPTTPMDAAFTFSGGSNNITLSHNLFTHLASRALFFDHGSQTVSVYANDFTDNGGGPVQWGDATDWAQTNPALQTSGLTFKDNQVDEPFEYLDSGGFFGAWTTNTSIAHNYFSTNPWAPLTLGMGWSVNTGYNASNTVTNNKVVNPCQTFYDCGDIYMTGGGQAVTTVSANYMTGNTANSRGCIYPDDGSTQESWTGNVCDLGSSPGAAQWLYIWVSRISYITVTGNWTSLATVLDDGTSDTISSNTTFTSGSPPTGAQIVITNAGIESGVTPGP